MTVLKRILHVEDDPSIQAVVKVALEAIGGYQVLSCSSGTQALQEVEGFAPQFILLDVMMPGMGGTETLARSSPSGTPTACSRRDQPSTQRDRSANGTTEVDRGTHASPRTVPSGCAATLRDPRYAR